MSEKLQETGVVSFVKGDFAYLQTDDASACKSCSSKSSCGSGRLNLTNKGYSLRVPNKHNLKQGDEVVLDISSDKLLFGTFLVYLMPLGIFFLFASVAKSVSGELFSVIAGLVGLLVGLIIASKIISIKRVARQFEPEVREKIPRVL